MTAFQPRNSLHLLDLWEYKKMPQLEQLTFGQLRDWLSDRLQLRGTAAASIERRRHETAYELPLQSWQAGDEAFRRRFVRAVNQILRGCNQNPWHPGHFHNLAALIEEGGIDSAAPILKEIAYGGRWLRRTNGRWLHMLVLRALLGLGHNLTPKFWLDENRRLHNEYPELIFRGLLAHGFVQAFSRINQIAHNADSMRRILKLFPSLIDIHGLDTIKQLVADAIPSVPDNIGREIRNWFPQWDYGELQVPIKLGYKITDEHFTVAGITRDEAADDQGWDDALPASSAADILKQILIPRGKVQAA